MKAQELKNMIDTEIHCICEGYWNDYKEEILNIIKNKALEKHDNPIRLEYKVYLFSRKKMPKSYDWLLSDTLRDYVSDKLVELGYGVEIVNNIQSHTQIYANIYWR